MMKTMNTSLTLMAISLAGCSAAPVKAASTAGRVIEFKSGPEGFDTRTFFYEGEREVIAFDAQFTPELARRSLEHLRRFTGKPVTWLVITHPNPDKFNGAVVFKQARARVVASESTARAIPGVHAYKENFFVNVAKMFPAGQYPQPTAVDQTFRRELSLVLQGGERIALRELSRPGVSSTQTVAFVESAKALFVGDLIHHGAHAWLEGGIINGSPRPDLDGWMQDLHELTKLYPPQTRVHGGRGRTAPLAEAVPAQIHYLREARALVRADLQRRSGPIDASAVARELTGVFRARFPNLELPYLIEYGAYGLVLSESRR